MSFFGIELKEFSSICGRQITIKDVFDSIPAKYINDLLADCLISVEKDVPRKYKPLFARTIGFLKTQSLYAHCPLDVERLLIDLNQVCCYPDFTFQSIIMACIFAILPCFPYRYVFVVCNLASRNTKKITRYDFNDPLAPAPLFLIKAKKKYLDTL